MSDIAACLTCRRYEPMADRPDGLSAVREAKLALAMSCEHKQECPFAAILSAEFRELDRLALVSPEAVRGGAA